MSDERKNETICVRCGDWKIIQLLKRGRDYKLNG
jgi:hypothetical protein